ncbi:MAG: nitrile hydratase subunit beta [Rubrivivax sp.]|nr:nitrile hydratase subunit beta [Rubrivivax sp.]
MSYHSHADLGGREGCGRVVPEPEGELWHAAWEPRAMALTVAAGATGAWNIDMSRAARETLPAYARLSYYEIWIHALERLLRERGVLHDDELADADRPRPGSPPPPRLLRAADVPAVLSRGAPTERPARDSARFAPGQRVRLRTGAVPHHTRLPGYARGRVGVVESLHGAHVFPDTHAQGQGEQPQWLYTVVFDGGELWGGEAGAQRLQVSIDAWEPYLEPA